MLVPPGLRTHQAQWRVRVLTEYAECVGASGAYAPHRQGWHRNCSEADISGGRSFPMLTGVHASLACSPVFGGCFSTLGL
eukprot:1142961-Pelagomonas_calceolata.AAC.3